MKKVMILLSTFNGEKFLSELMESLLSQDYLNVEILVRDDGSSDNTLSLLEKYIGKNPNIELVCGANLGVVRSFFRLLQHSSDEAEYFAFCDQDDVWKEDKVSRSIRMLEQLPAETPLLYCSRVVLVDEELNIIGLSPIPRRGPSFENALVQNIATGCTIVINKAAKKLLLRKIPKYAIMHDWWMYLVVSGFGKVIYDIKPRILYRQHSCNTIGAKTSAVLKWGSRIQRFLRVSKLTLITKQAEEFRKIYGLTMTRKKRMLLDRFIESRKNFADRIRYSFLSEVYRQSMVDSIILRLLMIINCV